MTITVEITQTVSIGQKPATNVTVTNLGAASDEMPFAAALTRAIVEFAEKYREVRA
jgi:hypothetical protein